MRAMRLHAARTSLRLEALAIPPPGPGQVLLRVHACAVCRTDLHVVDADLTAPKLPLTPGHEIIGTVAALGPDVDRFAIGDRVGVPWLGWTCGTCAFCRSGRENLCDQARFTGYQIDGGYADYTVADARFCFAIPACFGDIEAAPLLCAGLIGYRALVMAGDARCLGLYGFGAAAHIIAQVARWQGRAIFAFTSPGDAEAQRGALTEVGGLLDEEGVFQMTVDRVRLLQGVVIRAGVDHDDFDGRRIHGFQGGPEAFVAERQALGLVVGRNDE